jgi:type I restriction enzyme, S subunit
MKTDPIRTSEDHITETGQKAGRLHLIPPSTVLILVRGMILMHTIPICLAGVSLTINQDVKALMPTSVIDGIWLRWALQCLHPVILRLVSSAAHGTRKIELDRLAAILLPVPPLENQHRFVALAQDLVRTAELKTRAAEVERNLLASFHARLLG